MSRAGRKQLELIRAKFAQLAGRFDQRSQHQISVKTVATVCNDDPQRPLMAEGGRSVRTNYKAALLKPVPQVWQEKPVTRPIQPNELRSALVRRKLEAIRTKSSTSKPICIRCGDLGHLAAACRNPTICFVCNRLGHKAIQCRTATTTLPPSPLPHRPIPPQSTPKVHTTVMANFRTPIVMLTPTLESEEIEREIAQSFILDDIAGWGPELVESTLRRVFYQYT